MIPDSLQEYIYYQEKDIVLLHGDCLDILLKMKNDSIDLCLTDPPYGINADKAAAANKGKNGWKYYGETSWDESRPDKAVFDFIRLKCKEQVIWGGNYFADMLPPTMRYLIWDKGQRDFSLADFEMAWTSQHKASRILDLPRSRALKDGKQHPTQKPLDLIKWCASFFPDAQLILDPFLGSGTTAVAAKQLGRKCIGIELEQKYLDIAVERLKQEVLF